MAHEYDGLDEEMTPFDELEEMDLKVELAGQDEERTMFDPDTHPKPPTSKEEGITDLDGDRAVDMMSDTGRVEDEMAFDLTMEELAEIDVVNKL